MKFYNTKTTAIFENRLLSSGADKVSQKYEFIIKTDEEQSLLRFKLSLALVPLSQRQKFGLQRILLEGLIIFRDAGNSSIKI